MDTTYSEKAAALGAALVSSPRDWLPYLRYSPLWGKRPADYEQPWFSFGAIRFLRNYLRPTHRVFEYGSGGSTFFFARRTAHVMSVENDPAWHGLVSGFIRDRGLTNITCELHPLQDDELVTFQDSPFSQRICTGPWDVVVVDCHLGHNAARYGLLRPAAFAAALNWVKPGGLIVLDDSWMFPELLGPRAGWEITDFRGTGPCRYGVTSTAIFRRLN